VHSPSCSPWGDIFTEQLPGVRIIEHQQAKRARLAPFIPDGALIGTPDQLIEIFRDYARVGCQYVVFRTPDWVDVEPVQLFAERVIPALTDL